MKPIMTREEMADLLTIDVKTLYEYLRSDDLSIPPRVPLTPKYQIMIFDKHGWPEQYIHQFGFAKIAALRSLYKL